ncbi:MAG: M14 family metallopeptidase [Candidatus Marinimicrobia bacterium]|nr:M14 family metallopeptidase [Candidatus Neomarinimicrobiota bacterium]
MPKTISSLVFLLFILKGLLAQQLLTVAESSDYLRTSTYEEVKSFIRQLQKQYANIAVETMGTTVEGRDIPLMIIADPLPASPEDLKNDDRLVVYIQANIHAGEIEGKESALMLARDILGHDKDQFLEDLVILIVPIFNADGNEKFSTENRKTQNGPPSVGIRYNSQNLDLNRDAVKIESPEMAGMIENVLNRWDPYLSIDCHTTNGSKHEEPVTFVWANNPNGDTRLIEYSWSELRPFVKKNMKSRFDVMAVEYGGFRDFYDPQKGWESVGPEIRYVVNYIGLRNRLSLLLENYTYADYRTRVKGSYAFLYSVLELCKKDRVRIQEMVRQADREVLAGKESFVVAYETVAYDEKITLKSYAMRVTPRENYPWPQVDYDFNQPRNYIMPYFCKVIPARSVHYPVGYLINLQDREVVRKLQQHGIVVEQLEEDFTAEVEKFRLSAVTVGERLFQGHLLTTLKGEYETETRLFAKGTCYISTRQLRGNLAACLLEPECGDGLVTWNFFDKYLVQQWHGLGEYPVYKVYHQLNFAKTVVRK